jgi:hypothetical protein
VQSCGLPMIARQAATLYNGIRTKESISATMPPIDKMTRRNALGAATAMALASTPSSSAWTRDRVVDRPAGDHDAVTPEQYGALGDGKSDDTVALQTALDTGRSVRLMPERSYLLRSRLRLSGTGITLSGGGEIRIAPDFDISADTDVNGTHMRALFITGADVTISGLRFDASRAPKGSAVENGLIWSRAPGTIVKDCRFVGNPKGTSIWGLGDAPYLSVAGCHFIDCSGAVFAKGRQTTIIGNTIINAVDAAIAINGQSCVGAVVADNVISNEASLEIPAMIAVEEGASRWSISGNTMIGVNGGGIICTNILDATIVEAGVVSANLIDGRMYNGKLPVSNNPAALLSISSSYENWIVANNRILNCPTGNSNSRLVVLAASGGLFHDNIVDGSVTSGLSAMIGIMAGNKGITLRENKTVGAPGARHFLFGAGDYADAICSFCGGQFLNGAEGINTEMNYRKTRGLVLGITNISQCTAKSMVNASSALGDRADFLNAGAWARQHRIGVFTEMHCTAIPTRAGSLPFQPGDKLYYMDPGAVGAIGIVRTGTSWKPFGNLE